MSMTVCSPLTWVIVTSEPAALLVEPASVSA